MMARRIDGILRWWLTAGLLAGRLHGLEISEVLTDNQGGLADEDGDTPGWVEFRNDRLASENLAGWQLSDDPAQPGKWVFPARVLSAGERVVVFVSGKNRAAAGQPLHASFRLDARGEYLGLSAPDGRLVQAINPVPALRRNVSYAELVDGATVRLAGSGSPMEWRIPVATDGPGWKEPGGGGTGWQAGPLGAGFDAVGGGDFVKIDFNDRDANTAANTASGFQAFAIGSTGGTGAVQTGPVTRNFGALAVTLGNLGTDGYDDRLRATPANAAGFSEGGLLRDFVFSRDQTGTGGLEVTVAGLPPRTPLQLTVWSFDSGSPGTRLSDWTANGVVAKENYTFNGSALPTVDGQASFTADAASDAGGRLVLQGRRDVSSSAFGVFLNALSLRAASYLPHVTTPTGAMAGVNSSVRLRIPFRLTRAAEVTRLRLRVRYDDGFAAWINGRPVVQRNAVADPAWNAAALTGRSRGDALTPEEIVIPVEPGLLLEGDNLLAVQVLNESAGDTDLLFAPELEAEQRAALRPRYYAVPTPGTANAQAFDGLVADTKFSTDRGFHAGPFPVEITCATPGAQIRCTTDGSEPTETTGLPWTGPLTITRTTVLRAAAFRPGFLSSGVDTQTYLFMDEILRQPALPAGWPATWGINAEVDANDGARDGTVPGDYEMDPSVVNAAAAPGYAVADALRSLPVVSLSLAPGDFLGPAGIYQNPQSTGSAWERRCSMEFFDPSGRERDFSETCVVEVHGNSSRRPWRMQKHSLRLSFRGEVGEARLRHAIFPGNPVDEFDKLILRASFTDSWGLVSWDAGRYRPDDSVYFRDVWMKRAHRDMGSLAPDSRWVHLYINGLYWGCHNLSERVEDDFVASHLGGRAEDYEVVDDFTDPDPSPTSRWKSMFGLMSAPGSLVNESAYSAVQEYVDVAQFADYYLLHVLTDCEDWPHHNGYAWRRRTGPDLRFRFGVWDQEIMLDNPAIDRVSPSAPNTATDRTAGRLYQRLRENGEWRLLFADRVRRHLFPGGVLTLSRNQQRWQSAANELDVAIVAESARWGDTAEATPYGNTESRPGLPVKPVYTREADWLPSVAAVRDSYLPAKHADTGAASFFTRLRGAGLWPTVTAPEFARAGGVVAPGFSLAMTAATGTIYYTLDGSDPREAYTGNPRGTAYSAPVALTQTVLVRARARSGTVWSPLTEARFIVGVAAGPGDLAVARLHYHPPEGSQREFIEVMNIRDVSVDLTGVAFTAGIACQFSPGTVLAPQARLVLAADAAAFSAAWPDVTPAGQYEGRLDNAGESLVLTAADGRVIRSFRYSDQFPWPEPADGGGPALTLIAPLTNPDHNDPASWRPSTHDPLRPGTDDAIGFSGNPLADTNGNGRADLLDYALGDATPSLITADGMTEFQIVRFTASDRARLTPETSPDLTNWTPLDRSQSLQSVSYPKPGRQDERWSVPRSSSRLYLRVRAELQP